MGKHRVKVTTNGVATDMGMSPQRVRELQRGGVFDRVAKLVNPRKRNYVWWDNDEFRRFRKNWGRREKRQLKVDPKDALQLKGDEKDRPQQHYLTFVNNFWKWDRHLEIGLAKLPPVEVMRHELESLIRRLGELLGADWMRAVIKDLPAKP